MQLYRPCGRVGVEVLGRVVECLVLSYVFKLCVVRGLVLGCGSFCGLLGVGLLLWGLLALLIRVLLTRVLLIRVLLSCFMLLPFLLHLFLHSVLFLLAGWLGGSWAGFIRVGRRVRSSRAIRGYRCSNCTSHILSLSSIRVLLSQHSRTLLFKLLLKFILKIRKCGIRNCFCHG